MLYSYFASQVVTKAQYGIHIHDDMHACVCKLLTATVLNIDCNQTKHRYLYALLPGLGGKTHGFVHDIARFGGIHQMCRMDSGI